jgi:hypothetical protein
MRLPYEFWLKYLLVSAQATERQIGELCALYQLPTPSSAYLSMLRLDVDGRRHVTDAPTLRRMKIKSLALNEPAAVAARELVTEYRVRPILEALILGGLDDKDCSFYLESIAGHKATPAVLGLYRHYFWNPSLLSNADWDKFLKDYHGRHGERLIHCLLRGEEFTLWKLGVSKQVDPNAILSGIMYESAMRFKELSSHGNGHHTAMAAKMWAESVFKAAEMLTKDEDELRKSMTELSNFAMKLGRREISSLETLNKLEKE